MRKQYKILLALVLTGSAVAGAVIRQYGGREAERNNPVYNAMLEKTFSGEHLSYRYQVTVFNDNGPVDTTWGAIYKAGTDYIDSNDMYYKALTGDVFVNLDRRTSVAYYAFLKDVEQKLGFKREDMNAELFSLPDSSLAKIGHWKPIEQLNDSLSAIEFEVTDSTQQLQKARFVIHRNRQQIVSGQLTLGPGTVLGDQSAEIEMSEISTVPVDTRARTAEQFSLNNGVLKPSASMAKYHVQKLF
ncbi:hypothetical protein [Edaphocola aurantiacus]|uniref:hypothetical protein n=1 Tax=Edaphocola aurantiacus TaxID=2601682 RepID=UPI001C9887CA|nr:hypothetical protein [Edaphocola aurantiacus]